MSALQQSAVSLAGKPGAFSESWDVYSKQKQNAEAEAEAGATQKAGATFECFTQHCATVGPRRMAGFAKLFASITESSVWVEPDYVLRVWIAMLARADHEGVVEGSIPGFANLCRISNEQMEEAVKRLSSADPYSRCKDNDGRRIDVFDGGWHVLNYTRYREQAQAKEGSRAPYYRTWRAKKRAEDFRRDPGEEG